MGTGARAIHCLVLLAGLGLSGCAGQASRTSVGVAPPSPTPEPTAGETQALVHTDALMERGLVQFQHGENGRALASFRQAFLGLPSGEVGDERRDLLVNGMAQAWMRLYLQDHDRSHLQNAKQVLDRYLVKHRELFGEEPGAGSRARMRILLEHRLSLIEAALEAPPPTVVAHGKSDDHAGEEIDDEGMEREVQVKTKVDWAEFADPRVMAFLRHPLDTGPSLFDVARPWNPRRPLVRVAGIRGWERDRAFAKRVAKRTVSAFERCYDRAIERDGAAAGSVHLVHQPKSRARPFVVLAPPEVDAAAISCVEHVLANDLQARERPQIAGRMRVDFFWQRSYYGPIGMGAMNAEYAAARQGDAKPIDTRKRP